MDEIEIIFLKIESLPNGLTNKNHQERLREGYSLLVRLKELDVLEKTAYDRLMQIYLRFEKKELEHDFMADLMDYIVGWCNKALYVWKKSDSNKK